MRRFFAFLLGSISAIVVLLALYQDIPYISLFIKQLELQTIDYRMKFSKQPDVARGIKIVMVNDVNNLSDKLATFTKFIASEAGRPYRPSVIGFNYLFNVPSVDEELVTGVSMANSVYYGYHFDLNQQQPQVPELNQDILPFRLEITDLGEGKPQVLQAQDVQLPAQRYLTTARGIGFVNTLSDGDGVYRRIPLFLRYQENWYGSLALLMAMEYLGIESIDITFYPGQYLEIVQDDGSFIKIPVNQYGQMLIDFAYDPTVGGVAPFEVLSMEDDILAYIDEMNPPSQTGSLAKLKDAVVLVGSEGQAASALPPIPLTKSYPLIGIHANAINNILKNHFLRELRPEFVIGIVLLISMVLGLIISGRRFFSKIFIGLLLSALYLLIVYGIFYQFKLLIPIVPPLLSIGLTVLSVGVLVRHKRSIVTSKSVQQPVKDKKHKTKTFPVELEKLENELIEIRDELDRKSFRLRSKIEELRVLQDQGKTDQYEYIGQVAALQKEIRAREIEIKSLIAKEDEMRRQLENIPFTDLIGGQFRQNPEKLRRLFAKHGFISHSESILNTFLRIERLGKTSVSLLIQGEFGTGKKLLADAIHKLSTLHNRPLLKVICAGDMDLLEDNLFGHIKGAFPGADEPRNGFFRELDGATLILEEINNLSMELQTKLIQTLRGKAVYPIGGDYGYPIDVRVIATTTENLKALVSTGRFREDLYRYFSVFPLYLPPLRDRKEDIPALVNHFVQKYNHVYSKIVETVSDEAINLLIQYQWPGNITELEKVIERAIAQINPGVKQLTEYDLLYEEADMTGGIKDSGMLNYLIALMDSNSELPSYQQLREKVLVEIQRMYCVRLLRLHNGDVRSAAIDTGLKEETFKKMLSELMIDPDYYRI